MSFTWSKEQLQAIEESNKSILVNAGAGSGKTAVLTERLLRKVQNGTKLENLIVLTFTKLAALEMKERLRKALIKSSSNNQTVKQQLDYIDQANIQTFDAFTSELVRKYHYLLNIPSKINVVDSATITIKKYEILNQIFKEKYERKEPAFENLIDLYSTKDDKNIITNIINIYDKMRVDPDYLDLLNNYDQYLSTEYLQEGLEDFNEYLKSITLSLEYLIERMYHLTSDIKLEEHYLKTVEYYNSLKECSNYEDYKKITQKSLPAKPKKVEDEELKALYDISFDMFKKGIEKIKGALIYQDIDEIVNSFNKSKPLIMEVVNIILELDKRLDNYKKKYNFYEFIDISVLSIRLLEENDELREYIRDNTEEILVDEYQDTSDIQEKLISLISNNNVYMVGDVKQSIYRFRNANPEIFKTKYDLLNNSDNGLVINLSNNFRSRKDVLNNINTIFERLMSKNIGGVDYDNSHSLKYGLKSYDENVDKDNYDLKILTYDDGDLDFVKEYSKTEIEAFIIARDIINRVGKEKVYDKELGSLRLSKYSDYVILTSDKDKFELYKRIFEYFHIPLFINKDEEFVANDEIYVVVNLLKIIYGFTDDNYLNKICKPSLTSVLRSFLVPLDDPRISRVITSDNIILSLKLEYPDFYQKIVQVSEELKTSSISTVINTVYREFDIYNKISLLDEVQKVEYRLNKLYNMICDFGGYGYSLKQVIDCFTSMFEDTKKFDIKFSSPEKDQANNVKMMSIHASKGLEFPICYFPEEFKKFNLRDNDNLFIYSSKYKIIIPPIINGLIYKSFFKVLENNFYHQEEVSEKIRLLYVALTRAREQMIVVSPKYNQIERQNSVKIDDFQKAECSSFYDLLDSINPAISKFEEQINLEKLELTKAYENRDLHTDLQLFEEDKILSFYQLKSNKKAVKQGKASMHETSIKTKNDVLIMEKGSKLHKAFEVIDLKRPLSIQIENFDLDFLDKKKLLMFADLDLFKNKTIMNDYHEYSFEFKYQNEIINGIIDLILETKDELIVIDYKLSDIDREEYSNQVKIYMKYLSSVSNKKVSGYLYSINKGVIKEI